MDTNKKNIFYKMLMFCLFSLMAKFNFGQVLMSETNPSVFEAALEKTFAPVTLFVDNQVGYLGQVVCVDILVNGFEDILDCDFTFAWNNGVMSFDHLEGFNLPNMDNTNFAVNAAFGSIGLNWSASGSDGATLTDGSILFSACFEVIGNVGDFSIMAFTSVPTSIFITDETSNGAGVTVLPMTGQLTVIPAPDPLTVNTITVENENCLHKGSIELSISGGLNPLSFDWSHGLNTKNAYELSAGMYSVTITDSNNPATEIVVTEEIFSDLEKPVSMLIEDVVINCLHDVALDGSGSSTGADLSYLWSSDNGDLSQINGPNAVAKSVGDYQLIVANTVNGCADTANVSISLNPEIDLPFAGMDTMLCNENYILDGNLPLGVIGLWGSDDNQFISNPSIQNPDIGDLNDGENIFTWSFSADDCPDLGTDSVIINFLATPEAIDDVYTIPYGTEIPSFDVLENDIFHENANWFIDFDNLPSVGVLEQTDDTGAFQFTTPADFEGTLAFEYEICSDICEFHCSLGTVKMIFEERIIPPYPNLDSIQIFNAFTPNGDGLNDVLIFDILDDYPEDSEMSDLKVFNRYGDIVYESAPYGNDWNGTNKNGKDVPSGTYYYILTINLGQNKIINGDVTLLRK